ncbi:DinB family protein [Sporosarcina sp. ANT_H38]|uniref:DinB family protein n=1 Tax=Sporosarcina sp. ANT_H38 TaxID=2597358 RepID=UPI0011F0B162|nr:DinB family protein [Sporosarcina sp. ANT_H38]KAA0942106.1 DinB family protein [Sporosarcina sp. ANT_H38]
MTYSTVLPIWNAIRERFLKTAEALPEQDLSLQLGKSTVASLLHHTAEVEFMFAEWFFGRNMPGEKEKPSFTNLEELVKLLRASNEHLIEAMKELPEEDWHKSMESPIGASTPLEAVGRLMYHTGIHAGQISLIQKNGKNQSE